VHRASITRDEKRRSLSGHAKSTNNGFYDSFPESIKPSVIDSLWSSSVPRRTSRIPVSIGSTHYHHSAFSAQLSPRGYIERPSVASIHKYQTTQYKVLLTPKASLTKTTKVQLLRPSALTSSPRIYNITAISLVKLTTFRFSAARSAAD